jgi:hypothetical protein
MTPTEQAARWLEDVPASVDGSGVWIEYDDAVAHIARHLAVGEWKPIETAPRNGEWFEARTEHGTVRTVHFADAYDRYPISGDGEVWSTAPTEWMPLTPNLAPGDDLVERGKTLALHQRQLDLHPNADIIEGLLARISALTAENRESAMQALASTGQAQEAYEAQLAAEAEVATLRDRLARMEGPLNEALIKQENDSTMWVPEWEIWAADARAALTDGGSNG